MGRYATSQELNRQTTYEDIARIHNGGPNGYRNSTTLSYWEKVKTELARQKTGRQTQGGRSTGHCNCLTTTVAFALQRVSQILHTDKSVRVLLSSFFCLMGF